MVAVWYHLVCERLEQCRLAHRLALVGAARAGHRRRAARAHPGRARPGRPWAGRMGREHGRRSAGGADQRPQAAPLVRAARCPGRGLDEHDRAAAAVRREPFERRGHARSRAGSRTARARPRAACPSCGHATAQLRPPSTSTIPMPPIAAQTFLRAAASGSRVSRSRPSNTGSPGASTRTPPRFGGLDGPRRRPTPTARARAPSPTPPRRRSGRGSTGRRCAGSAGRPQLRAASRGGGVQPTSWSVRENAGWRPACLETQSRPCSAAITSSPRRAWWLWQPSHHGSSSPGSRWRSASCRSSRLSSTPSRVSEIASTASWTGSAKPSSMVGQRGVHERLDGRVVGREEGGPEGGDLLGRHDRGRRARVVERDDRPPLLIQRRVQPSDRHVRAARDHGRDRRPRRRVLDGPRAQDVERR